MKPVIVDPCTDSTWATLVETQASDVFHSPAWLRALGHTYSFEPQAVMLVDDAGRPVAGLPFCVVDGPPAKRLACPPFSDYCDPIVSSHDEWRMLSERLAEERCTISVRCLHNGIPVEAGNLAVVGTAAWHGVDLDAPLDELWGGLHSAARRAIRKANRDGVEVRRAASVADLRAFFELHLRVRKYKYRLLAQPYAFFENLWKEFVAAGNGTIDLAVLDGRLLAGVFFLEWRDRVYYKFNASDPEAASFRPNDLIVWKAIEAATERGLSRLDFGLSDVEQHGLLRYKRKYATEEKVITFLRQEIDPPDPMSASRIRAAFPALTELFTADSVPDSVTERAGDLLYEFFA